MHTLINGVDILSPLQYFYQSLQHVFPEIQILDGPEIPEPAHELLVHDNDMTPTLMNYFGQNIHLHVLCMEEEHSVIKREVILQLDKNNAPVEFGAIKIDISLMPKIVQDLIREGRQPLGGIINEHGVGHSSCPSGYFKVTSDDIMQQAFHFEGFPALYGSCNTLKYANGHTLAEVVEVLPPLHSLNAIRKELR